MFKFFTIYLFSDSNILYDDILIVIIRKLANGINAVCESKLLQVFLLFLDFEQDVIFEQEKLIFYFVWRFWMQ